jgi:hypothetical protein
VILHRDPLQVILYTALDVAAKLSFALVYLLRVPARHQLRSAAAPAAADPAAPVPPAAPAGASAVDTDATAACRGCCPRPRAGGAGGDG